MSKYKLIVRHKFREKYAMNTQFPAVVLKHIATYAIGGGGEQSMDVRKTGLF